MGGIFINYRRDERSLNARAVAEAARRHFGDDAVFFDRSIEPGTVYPDRLDQWLAECDVLIAIIHDTWLADLRAKNAARKDWVRYEIATALATGKPVIPVLIGPATVPPHDQLPVDLVRLADPQQAHVRPESADADLDRLLQRLERYVAPAAPPAPPSVRPPARPRPFPALVRRAALWSVLALLGTLVAALLYRSAAPPLLLVAVPVLSVFIGCYLLLARLVVLALQRPILALERKASTQSSLEYVGRSAVLLVVIAAMSYAGIHYAAARLPTPLNDYLPIGAVGVALWWSVGVALRGYRIDRSARSAGVPGVTAGWRRDGKPDPFVWRRAAAGLHERLTASPDWRQPRSRARQAQVSAEYDALRDAHTALLRQAGRPWSRWLSEDHPGAVVLYTVWAATTVGLLVAAVTELIQTGRPPLRTVAVAVGTTILVCGMAATGIRLGHSMMRRRDTQHAAELAGHLADLEPLAANHSADVRPLTD